MRRRGAHDGQTLVELVAILPALVLVGLVVWWMAVAGHTWTLAAGAARAGSRAAEVGAPARAAALSSLPSGYARGAIVTDTADGRVRVGLAVPSVVPFLAPQRVAAESGERP
jgi:hypothetical protein